MDYLLSLTLREFPISAAHSVPAFIASNPIHVRRNFSSSSQTVLYKNRTSVTSSSTTPINPSDKRASNIRRIPTTRRSSIAPHVLEAQAFRKAGNWRHAKHLLYSAAPDLRENVIHLNELLQVTATEILFEQPRITPYQLWSHLSTVMHTVPANPDSTSFNAIFTALRAQASQNRVRSDHPEFLSVLHVVSSVFDLMCRKHTIPDHFTMSIIFQMCAFRASSDYLRHFEKEAKARFNFKPNTISGSALLSAYLRIGAMNDIIRIIDYLTEQEVPFNERTYTTIISAYSRHGNHAKVLHFFNSAMRSPVVIPSAFLFSGALSSCSKALDSVNAVQIFETMEVKRVFPNATIMNLMFDIAQRTGDYSVGMKFLFEWSPKYNTTCVLSHYRKLISAWKKSQGSVEMTVKAVYEVVERMHTDGNVQHHISTYNAVISTLSSLGRMAEAQRIMGDVIPKLGLIPTVVTYNTMIHAYGKVRKPLEALKVLRLMKERGCSPNEVTYNSILEALFTAKDPSCMGKILQEMEGNTNLKMSVHARTSQLKYYRSRKDGKSAIELERNVRREGKVLDAKAYSLLLCILFEWNEPTAAISLFGWLLWKGIANVLIFNVVIDKCRRLEGECEQCVPLFQYMKRRGILPNAITYTSMIHHYSNAGRIDHAFRLLGEMQDIGLGLSDVYAWTALMNGCRRTGHWERAVELLRKMQESRRLEYSLIPAPSSACYNAALYAAGIGGCDWGVVVEIYEAFKQETEQKPDFVTYSTMASIILNDASIVKDWHTVRQICDAFKDYATNGKNFDTTEFGKKRAGGSNRKFGIPDRKKLLSKFERLKALLKRHEQY